MAGFQACILLKCQKPSVLRFLDFLKENAEKREAAPHFRPVYCSNVFQMSPFLDTF